MKFKWTCTLLSVILFLGFSWPGQKNQAEKKTPPRAVRSAEPTPTPAPVVAAPAVESAAPVNEEVPKPEAPAPVPSPSVDPEEAKIAAVRPLADLTSKLVTSDEQETAQRAESMRRLAEALRRLAEQKEQQQQQQQQQQGQTS